MTSIKEFLEEGSMEAPPKLQVVEDSNSTGE